MDTFIRLFIFFNLSVLCELGFGQVIIDVHINKGDTIAISYYKPFQDFANDRLKSIYNLKSTGNFSMQFDIDKPTFIKFVFDQSVVQLLCERNDTISLYVKSSKFGIQNWLVIEGNNAKGHMHFNTVYNKIPMDKFYNVRDVFERYKDRDTEILTEKIQQHFEKDTEWIDSLFSKNRTTSEFSAYMRINILGILAWEVGELCNKYFEQSGSELSLKSAEVKAKLFEQVDPMDYRMRRCLATNYYSTYYSEIYKKSKPVDESAIVVEDTPFYALAPMDLQGYLWGGSLYAHYVYDPNKAANCKTYHRYKLTFSENPYTKFFDKSDICSNPKTNKSKIIESLDTDLFTLINHSFHGKRIFIDLWATWCSPCKIEFASYKSTFYEFLKLHRIELAFISIDKPEFEEQWKKEISDTNLNGYHILAGPLLQSSIKEVVYDSGTVVIPRYILVDEKGRLLSIDFKRPSDELFQAEIIRFFGM